MLSHFGASTLDGFGLQGMPLAIRAAGGILQYLKETEGAALALLSGLRVYSLSEFMTLDAATRRNLELTETLRGEIKGSLLGVLDQTVTPMGKRRIRQWVSQPLLDVDRIRKRAGWCGLFCLAFHAPGGVTGCAQAFIRPGTSHKPYLIGSCPTSRPGGTAGNFIEAADNRKE